MGGKRSNDTRYDALCAPSPACARRSNGTRPLYGVEGQGWFLGLHCFANYVRVAFFRSAVAASCPAWRVRDQGHPLLYIYEDDPLDEAQFAASVKQASLLPGDRM